jgi:hypothetical protein
MSREQAIFAGNMNEYVRQNYKKPQKQSGNGFLSKITKYLPKPKK